MMSNGTPPPAPHVVTIYDNARWLFPLERAPPPPLEGCLTCGKNGDPAHSTSNGSLPTPSPPSKSSRPPSNISTSFPTLVTMGGIAPVGACPPPAVLTDWRIYACHDSPGGPNMVNLRSGEKLWPPPASVWDLIEWDIVYSPHPTWYRVPESRRWVHLDFRTSWIHLPTKYEWYLVEDTARPVCARPSLPHQTELILAKFTLRRMTLPKRGGDATPVASGRSFSPTLPHPKSYMSALLSTLGRTASRRHTSFSRQQLTCRPPSRSNRRLADANGLGAALVDATDLGHPIHQTRPFPPNLYQQWGGQQCRLRPIIRRHERPRFVAPRHPKR
jgi:hypothetical protein